MRRIIALVWVTLDGVFDADTMNQWNEMGVAAKLNSAPKYVVHDR